jgi:hypothetical protein
VLIAQRYATRRNPTLPAPPLLAVGYHSYGWYMVSDLRAPEPGRRDGWDRRIESSLFVKMLFESTLGLVVAVVVRGGAARRLGVGPGVACPKSWCLGMRAGHAGFRVLPLLSSRAGVGGQAGVEPARSLVLPGPLEAISTSLPDFRVQPQSASRPTAGQIGAHHARNKPSR